MNSIANYNPAQMHYENSLAYVPKQGEAVLARVEDINFVNTLMRVQKVAETLGRKIDTLFKTVSTPSGNRLKATTEGQSVINALRSIEYVTGRYPFHAFNPFVEIFVNRYRLSNLRYMLPDFEFKDSSQQQAVADELNKFVYEVRSGINDTEFKRKMNSFKRVVNKNYASLNRYISAQFLNHSRLLVLRIDFSYLGGAITSFFEGNQDTPPLVNYEEVRKHREQLIAALKKSICKDTLIGYAWKLEYGLLKGYHTHMIIFLDGSKVREDITIADLIGKHWVNEITGGHGLFYNCNKAKHKYKSCGIGMISHHEVDKIKGLRLAAQYITKTEYYMQFVITRVAPAHTKDRTFGKGIMPKLKKCNRGRPRQGDPDNSGTPIQPSPFLPWDIMVNDDYLNGTKLDMTNSQQPIGLFKFGIPNY